MLATGTRPCATGTREVSDRSDLVFDQCRPAEALERYAWPGEHDHVGIDLLRLDDDGEVVEHRDVLQVVPDHSADDGLS